MNTFLCIYKIRHGIDKFSTDVSIKLIPPEEVRWRTRAFCLGFFISTPQSPARSQSNE